MREVRKLTRDEERNLSCKLRERSWYNFGRTYLQEILHKDTVQLLCSEWGRP